jgi:hypothetical protein
VNKVFILDFIKAQVRYFERTSCLKILNYSLIDYLANFAENFYPFRTISLYAQANHLLIKE